MIRHYGAAAYREVMTWPYRLILRGIVIGQQVEAARQLTALRLSAVADGMEQGRQWIDPKNPHGNRKWDDPYYDLKPYQAEQERLSRVAFPWEYTEAALIRRREAEEEAEFAALERTMGKGVQA